MQTLYLSGICLMLSMMLYDDCEQVVAQLMDVDGRREDVCEALRNTWRSALGCDLKVGQRVLRSDKVSSRTEAFMLGHLMSLIRLDESILPWLSSAHSDC